MDNEFALWVGFLLLLGERITRIVMDALAKRTARRNESTSTSNPGLHSLAGPLASLATLSTTVLAVTERTEASVKENKDENKKAHTHLHERIDQLRDDVVEVRLKCATLEARQ